MLVSVWNIVRGTAALLLFIGLNVVLPIWGISRLRRWLRHRRENRPQRKYKIISFPIIALNAIPGFIGFMVYEMEFEFNEDVLGAMMTIICVITIIHAIVTCRLSGLWIGPVRILLGFVIGASVGFVLIALLGIFMLLGLSGSSEESDRRTAENTKYIYKNGRRCEVYRLGDSDHFRDPETNDTLTMTDDSNFVNQDGESFKTSS